MLRRKLSQKLVSILLTVLFPFGASVTNAESVARCESIFLLQLPIAPQGLTQAEVTNLLHSGRIQESIWLSRQIGNTDYANSLKNDILNTFENGQVQRVERYEPGFNRTVSEVYLVYFTNGMKGLFKADPLYWTENDAQNGVLANSKSDMMASRFDEVLGLNIVPLAIQTEVQGMTGSLQTFVDMKKQLDYTATEIRSPELRTKDWELLDLPIQNKKAMLRLFDYLIYNTDRHDGNSGRWISYSKFPDHILPGQGSGLVAFDNSASFQPYLSAKGNYRPSSPEGLKIPIEIAKPFLEALITKLTPEIIQKEMKGIFKQNIIDEVIERRTEILNYYHR